MSYAEYKSNLYTKAAMGCVTNGDASNIFEDSIPLAAIAERFATETVEWLPTSYVRPGDVIGVNENGTIAYGPDEHVIDPNNVTCVRKSDGRIHGRFGADSGNTRRQYEFLLDLATGITRDSRGELLPTGAGTVANGARGYIQFSTSNWSCVAGMDYAPFVTLGMGQDGKLPVVSSRGSLIIACANQVAGLLGASKATGARTKQTKNRTSASIITAHTVALQITHEKTEMDNALETMAGIAFTDKHYAALLDTLAPVNVKDASKAKETRNENMRELLTGLRNTDSRVAPWKDSLLGAAQLLNVFDIWERGTRGDTNALVRQTDELLSGDAFKRENSRMEMLTRVMASV
jgi:hypothetical protein